MGSVFRVHKSLVVSPKYFRFVDFRHFGIMHFLCLLGSRKNWQPPHLEDEQNSKPPTDFAITTKSLRKIFPPHHHATTKRCQQQKIVLCAQDTSELDFTRPQQQVAGAGPLACSSRLGAFLHLDEAFTEDGTPLGAIDAKLWAREEPDPEAPKLSKVEKEKKRLALPIEEKESFRWLEGIRAVQQLAWDCPETTCISVSDSDHPL